MQVRKKVNKPLKYYSIYVLEKNLDYPDKELFRKTITLIFEKAKEELLTRHQVRLTGLGHFFIRGVKVVHKLVDYGMTRKLGKVVYHTNFHSGRVRYEIKWRDRVFDRVYKFEAYRFLKRDLAKTLKEDHE
jgi:ATP-dependent Zn protease